MNIFLFSYNIILKYIDNKIALNNCNLFTQRNEPKRKTTIIAQTYKQT